MGLFSWVRSKPRESAAAAIEDAELQAGVEQVVEQIDPRLRLIGGYQKKLKPAVEAALSYGAELAGRLPAAREASAGTWNTDATIHALFTSVEDLRTFFGRSKELRAFFSSPEGSDLDAAIALLAMSRREQTRLGTRSKGDTIERDVLQTSVDFIDRVLLAPVASENEVRSRLEERVFERLVLLTLADLASKRSRKDTLERERAMLKSRLKILEGKSGRGGALFEPAVTGTQDLEAVQEELARNERDLREVLEDVQTLDYSLEHVKAVLGHPQEYFSINPLTLRLDRMNIKLENELSQVGEPVMLMEATVVGQPARCGLLVKYPRAELPPEEDLFEKARHYLG